ncbi:NHL repeat-containing protein [candidate division KSB1 bacterium]
MTNFNIFLKIIFVYILLYSGIAPAQEKYRFEFAGEIGSKGIAPGQMQSPQGISVDFNGDIYIADTGNNRIQKFSSNGRFMIDKGGFGWEDEQFDQPVDIYAERGLDVLVSDKNNNRVIRYDRNLNFISTTNVENFSRENFRFQFPLGLTSTALGDIFVIDSENNRVVKINSFGKPDMEFGGYGSSGETLVQPERIAVFRTERIYISDKGKKSVAVYDYFGNYLSSIGDGLLEEPEGITLDSAENLYVCDPQLKKICMFSSRGVLLAELSDDRLGEPADAAVFNDRLYIADAENSYVLIFLKKFSFSPRCRNLAGSRSNVNPSLVLFSP